MASSHFPHKAGRRVRIRSSPVALRVAPACCERWAPATGCQRTALSPKLSLHVRESFGAGGRRQGKRQLIGPGLLDLPQRAADLEVLDLLLPGASGALGLASSLLARLLGSPVEPSRPLTRLLKPLRSAAWPCVLLPTVPTRIHNWAIIWKPVSHRLAFVKQGRGGRGRKEPERDPPPALVNIELERSVRRKVYLCVLQSSRKALIR